MARKRSADGRTITSHGYVLIWKPDHPMAHINGYVYEHRLILSEKLGRILLPKEIVHHIDGNKQNNDPDNLELEKTTAHHLAHHRKSGSSRRFPDEENPIVSCACGCGLEFFKYDESDRPREYISGHNPRKATTMDLILNALSDGPKRISELRTLRNGTAIVVCLSKLKKRGLIHNPQHGLWQIAQETIHGN